MTIFAVPFGWHTSRRDCILFIIKQLHKMLKQYETVFIATPVLSEQQMKEAVAKYTKLIADNGGEVVYEEDWGLRQLAYPIQHKTSGFYYLIQFQAEPEFIEVLETQYFRDERIIRFLTVSLDKHAVAYAERRRENRKKAAAAKAEAAAAVEAPAEAVAEEPKKEENA
jgi:small subunit ribosomal protein S6